MTKQSRWNRRPRARRGYSLVFVALMLFGIMALGGLVIDLGFARLAQRQMQVAADSAALEGLRGEGDDAMYGYPERLDTAQSFVHWHFDDDLDTSGDDGAFDSGSGQFGMGPLVEFSGGLGDPSMAASQLMVVDPDNPVYKPITERGTHTSTSGSFQVDLRRGFTTASTAHVFSDGPSVPYLFARGSLLNRQMVARGIIVSGSAEATTQPAMSIGAAYNNHPDPNFRDLPGMISIAIRATHWMNMSGTRTLNINPADRRLVEDSVRGNVGFVTDSIAVSIATSAGSQPDPDLAAANFVESLISNAATRNDALGPRWGYLLVVGDATMPPVDHVIGFGFVGGLVQTGPDTLEVTKWTNMVASENATVIFIDAPPSDVAEDVVASASTLGQHTLFAPASRNAGP